MACLIPILSITRKVIKKVPFTATGSEDGFFYISKHYAISFFIQEF